MSLEEGEEVIRLAARGDGVTATGKHVPGAAPGDRLLDDGSLVHGPNHVEPPCQHYGKCGGCELQYVAQHSYAAFVQERIATNLQQQEVACGELLPAIVSPPRSRRRVSLKALKRGGSVMLGFNEGKSHRVIDLRQCEIMRPELFALIEPLRGLLNAFLAKGKGATVAMTLVDQGADILITGIVPESLPEIERLTDFARTQGVARLAIDQGLGPETQWEPEPVTICLNDIPVSFPHNAFLQATSEGEGALVNAIQPVLGDGPVADLFAGLGTFAMAASEGRKVYAAEADRAAIMALQQAGRQSGRMIACEHRDLFRRPLMPKELNNFAAVILDPPRAGARDQVAQLAESDVPTIAYVSCNPSSFARDARQLTDGGYRLESVQPVAQFLWSTHVELAACFRR